MKKNLLIFAVFLFAFPIFARTGIGANAGISLNPSDTDFFASASVRFDTSPWGISVNAHFDKDFKFKNEISFAIDNWFVYERLGDFADFFFLWGISGGAGFEPDDAKNNFSAGTGARAGAGLSFMFFNRSVEIAFQAVWNPYAALEREDGDFKARLRPLNFPVCAQIRFWF